MAVADTLDLLDWKRRVFALYASVRADADPVRAWERWRAVRDDLFARHPQSPLEPADRAGFGGLAYFDYDPGLRLAGRPVEAPERDAELPVSRGERIAFRRLATVEVELGGGTHTLELHWLDAYGGGLFLAFRDATSGSETYGGGRYLLDTVKGADLGGRDGELVLDLNFAFNPSCAYSARWPCPLAPRANALPVAVRGGERAWRPPG